MALAQFKVQRKFSIRFVVYFLYFFSEVVSKVFTFAVLFITLHPKAFSILLAEIIFKGYFVFCEYLNTGRVNKIAVRCSSLITWIGSDMNIEVKGDKIGSFILQCIGIFSTTIQTLIALCLLCPCKSPTVDHTEVIVTIFFATIILCAAFVYKIIFFIGIQYLPDEEIEIDDPLPIEEAVSGDDYL